MSLSGIKKSVEKEHLIGISLRSLNNIGISDRAFNFSNDSEITFDKDRTLVRLGFNSTDADSRDDAENIIDLLRASDQWNDMDESLLIGEIVLTDKSPIKRTVTIQGKVIHQYDFKVYLNEIKSVAYLLTLTFSPVRYLHGLSMFHGVSLTKNSLVKLIPLLVNNAFGEIPVMFRYQNKGVLLNLVPDGLTDMVYTNKESGVWLFNTTTSRLGLDMEGSRGTITITENGYVLSIALKNKGTLEIFT